MVTKNKRETKGGFVMKIIMLGAPGAGKGTQAKQIAQAYDIPHISTGDIFRANIKEGTELGKKAQEYMDKGLLVPDELVCDLVVDRIHKDDCEKGYILDGFPRTIPQANALDEALAKDGEKIEFAIDIEVPDENIINRMSGRRSCKDCGAIFHVQYNPPKKENCCDVCGGELILRDDDKAETVKKRLDVYHEQTAPLIAHYKEVGSCSNLGDAQARRLRIRIKGENGNYFAHTLNNTVVAPPRMLIAFLENNLREDGSVAIPEVLRPYMGGKESLQPKK